MACPHAPAVAILGGPTCGLLLGRPDSSALDTTSNLPSICSSSDQLVALFGTAMQQSP